MVSGLGIWPDRFGDLTHAGRRAGGLAGAMLAGEMVAWPEVPCS